MNEVYRELQSPYQRGAEDGIIFGIYLAAMMFSAIFSMKVVLLNLVFLLLLVAGPVVIFVLQRRYYVSENGFATRSALWMQGLVMSGCGALLAFSLSFIYMRWVNPGYLDNTFTEGIATMKASGIPEMVARAEEFEKVTGGVNPMSAITFNIALIWLTILCGSITSLVLSFFVSLFPLKKKYQK